ncbi:MAG: peptidoglycan bridge formation glycyltransferase FemA/FemB family protein [bacterium]|nr:peptidoglycan bridge formation glycyltransferase FemA/FemB family protein [bacterium]
MHPLQTPAWEEFRKNTGGDTSRIDGFLITWHRIPFTPFKVGYLPKSELPTLPEIRNIEKAARQKNALLVRLEPDATRTESKNWLRSYGEILRLGRTLFTPQTFYLYLDKSEEELLAAMHPKARYNIRLAQKKGVIIEEDNSETAFKRYLELTFGETTRRQRFYAHTETYHRHMWAAMHGAKIAHLFTAKYQGKILVTWILFKQDGRLFFPYGASSEEHRDVQAPSLMLWETARWGKQQGCLIYDLWGAEEGKGFNRFKEQFGPQLIDLVGTWDLVINPLIYPFYRLAEEIRWIILRAIK